MDAPSILVSDLPSYALQDRTPSGVIAPFPEGYAGPYRVWGLAGSREAGTERWTSEIVQDLEGPFFILEHDLIPEWWDGTRWVATD